MKSVAAIACLLGLVSLVGCSNEPKRFAVAGEVTFKSNPIKFGTINFRAEDGSAGAAQIVDGKYSLPVEGGLLPGKYRVAINYPDPKIPPPTGNEAPGEAAPNREMLPKKYNSETTLIAEINPNGNNSELHFKLD